MAKEVIVRCTCERCSTQEEAPGGLFTMYPREWRKVEGRHICAKCSNEFKAAFHKFMAEGRKK